MFQQELSVFILAGGHSIRMGSDKGLVLLNQKPMIQYVVDLAHFFSVDIHIVSNQDGYAKFGLPVLSDKIPDLGPAGGINTVLGHSQARKNLVLVCDMPFLKMQTVQHLLEKSLSFDISHFSVGEWIHPFPLVITSSCADQWNELLQSGYRKLQDIFQHFAVQALDAERELLHAPDQFQNINDSEALKSAELSMRSKESRS